MEGGLVWVFWVVYLRYRVYRWVGWSWRVPFGSASIDCPVVKTGRMRRSFDVGMWTSIATLRRSLPPARVWSFSAFLPSAATEKLLCVISADVNICVSRGPVGRFC